MEDYQIRVIEEKKELDSKLTKLNAFINKAKTTEDIKRNAIPGTVPTDRILLIRQAAVMETYSNILGSRIQLFKKNSK